ncbi:MAG: xanthine dehydrogenase small subunit [Proteobacteria bacterium]|nr:xanthine dehydrogenase small subunit [Pseudomonadota bacterium]
MTDRIRFLLGTEPREIADADPTMTVLEYLRRIERRRGTKEGCAEGDCGACTVVVGECTGGGLRYRAVNSCIQLLPTLDGRQLLTVEDLADPETGALHPVQQAMVEAHGSQCGFCTPGFVMALYAAHQNAAASARTLREAADRIAESADTPSPSNVIGLAYAMDQIPIAAAPDRDAVSDMIAGNLCRCTGYRPIVDAGVKALAGAQPTERDTVLFAAAAKHLATRRTTLKLAAAGKRYFAPVREHVLADILETHPDATIVAGATDVGLWVTKQHRELAKIVYIGDVEELKAVQEHGNGWWIGAAATYTDALPAFADLHRDFAELVRRLGAAQVRNCGTIGGNIANASPIGDTPPALIALGATLHLRRGKETRHMPLEDFFLGYRKTALQPGEFVTGVAVPKPRGDQRFAAYKISKRFDQDISAVCSAYRITLSGGIVGEARIAHGGMAETPKRAPAAEAALNGHPWDETTMRRAMEALAHDYRPIDDMRASAAYLLPQCR